MWKEFKAFIMRGNVMDLAIGVIIGGAFGKIVSSLVDDVLMPPIGLLLGGVNFNNLFINLGKTKYATLAQAQEAGAPTIKDLRAFALRVADVRRHHGRRARVSRRSCTRGYPACGYGCAHQDPPGCSTW